MISFVIRTKNEIADIERTLAAVVNQKTNEEIEIVIVDSGSSDGTIEVCEKFGARILRIKPEDFTWGYALNVGIKVSLGKYICLISGHCILENENVIQEAIEILRTHDIAALYGRQKGEPEKDPYECLETWYTFPDYEYVESNDGYNIPISNAGCLLKKEIWEEMPYDEEVQSAEDVIWARAICKEGYSIGYSNKFSILHGHPFNLQYIYRKWYWRNYWNRKKEIQLGKSNSYVYIAVSYLFKRPRSTYRGYIRAIESGLKIAIDRRKTAIYLIICYYAAFKAAIDAKKNRNNSAEFNDIKLPHFINFLGEKIR